MCYEKDRGDNKLKIFSKKRYLIVCLTIFIIGLLNIKKIYETIELNDYNSKSIYVYNLTDDAEVKSLNAEERRYPASLVKIMTTYIAIKNIDDLSKVVTIDERSYDNLIKENSSMAGFAKGERVTYRDLLYGTMLPSGGECAESLAIGLFGNRDIFIDEMNRMAKKLNLKNTNYKNVSGLDDYKQYSTAKDIAMLLKECLKDGNFRAIFTKPYYISTKTLKHPKGLYMQSTVLKRLKNIKENDFKIIGGKSGTTQEAGLCWATLSVKNGKEYIIVVMGSPFDDIESIEDGHIKDTLKLLEEID